MAGHDRERGGDRGEEVHVEGVAEVVLVDVGQPDAGILGRVVDQQVDRARARRRPRRGRAAARRCRPRRRGRSPSRREGAQVGRQLSRRSVVPGQADDGGAGPGQVTAELRAQAGRGAGDDSDLALVAPAEAAGGATREKPGKATQPRLGAVPAGRPGPSARRGRCRAAPPRRPARPGRPRAPPGHPAPAPVPRPGHRPGRARRAPWRALGVAEHDGRRAAQPSLGVQPHVGPAVGHREDHVHAASPRPPAPRDTGDHLGHAELPSAAASEPAPAAAMASERSSAPSAASKDATHSGER